MEVALRIHEADADRAARRGRWLPCSDRRRARRGRRRRSAATGGARTRRRSRRAAPPRRRELRRPPGLPRAGARAASSAAIARVVDARGTPDRAAAASSISVRDQPQHHDRVVRGLPPQRVVEAPEDLARRVVPGPPQVVGEFGKPCSRAGMRRWISESRLKCMPHQEYVDEQCRADRRTAPDELTRTRVRSMLPPETTATILRWPRAAQRRRDAPPRRRRPPRLRR